MAHDAKTRRHQPGCVAGVDALGQYLDLEGATGHAAQAGGQPQLVVVAGAGVQANHQRHVAQPRPQGIDIGQQIVGATLFAGLDQADDARMRNTLRLQRLYRGDAGVHRITVIGAAPTVQLAVLVFWSPWPEVLAPASELGLLVEVAVHQYRLRRCGPGRGDFEEKHRCAALEAHHLQPQPGHLLRLDPRRGVAHYRFYMAVLRPAGVEARGLGGNPDVFLEPLHDVAVPLRAGLCKSLCIVQETGREFLVQGSVHGDTLLDFRHPTKSGRPCRHPATAFTPVGKPAARNGRTPSHAGRWQPGPPPTVAMPHR